MVTAAPERPITQTAYEEIVIQSHGGAANQLDVSNDELVAAFAPSRLGDTHAILEVNGVEYESFRHQVGVVNPADRSRGGGESSPNVTSLKIFDKSLGMHGKHMLGETGNVGGKSGILISDEESAAMSRRDRDQLFAQHADAHHINPYTNVLATDIGSYGPDMDAVAESRRRQYGQLAGAAASGASRRYGGEPELHAPHTGKGASIVLDRYLRERAKTDPNVAAAIRGERAPLRVLVQGLGKAGAHFVETMPDYMQLAGALERHGAIVAEGDQLLDRQEVLDLAHDTQLSEAGVDGVDGALWLPPTARSQFWASANADIIVPAFDHHQYTAEDARNFGGLVIASLANHPLDEAAQDVLRERHIDELVDIATNIGGTISSQGIWNKIMHPAGWTPRRFEADWQRSMHRVADTILEGRQQLARERGEFVSFQEVAELVVVRRAVQRLRQSQQLAA